jgi:hypothetical protein
VADNGHNITTSARLGPQNAKTILGIMVRDALDETGKNLPRLTLGRAFHGRCGRITSCTYAILLKPAIGWQHWPRDLASRLKPFQGNPDGADCSIVELRKRLQLTAEMRCAGAGFHANQ